jgi:hypothetical protein
LIPSLGVSFAKNEQIDRLRGPRLVTLPGVSS